MARMRVSGPIRPENMSREMANFPMGERKGVMPKVRPTVPEAEMASKKMAKKILLRL